MYLARGLTKKINKEREERGKEGRRGKRKMGGSKVRKDKNILFCCLAEKMVSSMKIEMKIFTM